MKTIAAIILIILINSTAMGQYKPATKGPVVEFEISNLGFDVKGSFTGLQGSINFNPKTPESNSMDVTIDAATVNTDNTLRDTHLKDADYFDVKNYPSIRFVSAKITSSGKTNYVAAGKLTIKGKSKDITIPFSATSVGDEFLFKGSFKINRKDFGIGGTSTISNELELSLTVNTEKA